MNHYQLFTKLENGETHHDAYPSLVKAIKNAEKVSKRRGVEYADIADDRHGPIYRYVGGEGDSHPDATTYAPGSPSTT